MPIYDRASGKEYVEHRLETIGAKNKQYDADLDGVIDNIPSPQWKSLYQKIQVIDQGTISDHQQSKNFTYVVDVPATIKVYYSVKAHGYPYALHYAVNDGSPVTVFSFDTGAGTTKSGEIDAELEFGDKIVITVEFTYLWYFKLYISSWKSPY